MSPRQVEGRRNEAAPRLVLVGAVVAVAFWAADAIASSLLSDGGRSVAEALVAPATDMLVLRMLATAMILGSSAYAERLVIRRAAAERALERATYQLSLAYDNSPDAIAIMRPDLTVQYVNAAAERLAQCDSAAVVGRPCYSAFFDSDTPCDGCPVLEVLSSGRPFVGITQRSYRPGRTAYTEQTVYPVIDESGSIESVVQIVKDVTAIREAELERQEHGRRLEERVRERTAELERMNQALQAEVEERIAAEHALRESEARLRSLVELSPDLIMVHADGVILFMNPVGARLLGYRDPEDVVGRPVMEIVHPDSAAHATVSLGADLEDWGAPRLVELRLERADGSPIDVMTASTPLIFHGRPAIQAVAQDITARKRAEETVRRMAYYDTLTGLPNRALFEDRLAVAMATAERESSAFAVLFMDIDDFKAVNDSWGHAVGDEMLIEVARRLKLAVRRSDTVARMGGDEFTVLLPRVRTRDGVEQVITKILDTVALPVATARGVAPLTLSIGAALYPADGATAGTLVHAADMAMYAAKEAGERFRFAEGGVRFPA